jgi:hypothetical protein
MTEADSVKARSAALQLLLASVNEDAEALDLLAEELGGDALPDAASDALGALIGLAQALAGLPAMTVPDLRKWSQTHLLSLAQEDSLPLH